jgi:hypothetical protein
MTIGGRAQLRAFIDDCGKIPPDLRRELRPAIKKGAQPILDKMHSNASWSTRIPRATKISTSLAGNNPGVSIVVNARQAPHARVYEHGGQPGNFRAPLFGDRSRWFAHRARPFFYRAVQERGDEVTKAVAEAIDTVVKRHGF